MHKQRTTLVLLALVLAVMGAALGTPRAWAQYRGVRTATDVVADGAGVRLDDGRVLLVGTYDGGVITRATQIVDPDTGAGHEGAMTTVGRAGLTATKLPGGDVLVTGGHTGDGTRLASAERYHPATDSWTTAGAMAVPRVGHTALTLHDGSVLVVGGTTTQQTDLYDPASGTWRAGPTVPGTSPVTRAALTGDGKVLVLTARAARLLDPVTGAWSTAGSGPHDGYPVTLADGRVLVIIPTGRTGAAGEVFDPVSGTWSPTSRSTTPCYGPVATTRLDTGDIVVGCPPGDEVHAFSPCFTNIYDPDSDTWTWVDTLHDEPRVVVALGHGRALVAGRRVYTRINLLGNVPSPPRDVTAGGSAGDPGGLVQVSWEPPADDGGSPIVAYRVRAAWNRPEKEVPGSRRTVRLSTVLGRRVMPEVTAVNADGEATTAYVTERIGTWDKGCTLSGTAFADVLVGTAGPDVICGLGGDDRIEGMGGDDEVYGGAGTDTVSYAHALQAVTVTLSVAEATGQGHDLLEEVENIQGSPFDDVISNGWPGRLLRGGDGDDLLITNWEAPTQHLSGQRGDDRLELRAGGATGSGGAGSDTLVGTPSIYGTFGLEVDLSAGFATFGDGVESWGRVTFSGVENVVGSDNTDLLRGDDAANVLDGGPGSDVLAGRGGNDRLSGGAGPDDLSGGEGADTCDGGSETDTTDGSCETLLAVP